MPNQVSFLRYLLTCAVGFGIGGAVWGGWDLYGSDVDYPLTIIGAASLGIFGGLGLSIYSKNWKLSLKTIGLGVLGSIIGFFIALLGIYNLPNLGSFIVFLLPKTIIQLLYLPNLGVTEYWLNFFVSGIFIGLFYAIALKVKIWPMVWRGAVGFGFAAIVSPIIGNIIGNAIDSLFMSYLITFALIGAILGVFLGWGAYKTLVKP